MWRQYQVQLVKWGLCSLFFKLSETKSSYFLLIGIFVFVSETEKFKDRLFNKNNMLLVCYYLYWIIMQWKSIKCATYEAKCDSVSSSNVLNKTIDLIIPQMT